MCSIGGAGMGKRIARGLTVVAAVVLLSAAISGCKVQADPLQDIGTLGGPITHAYAVNDAGFIVGLSQPDWFVPEQGFIRDPATGVLTSVGTLVPGGSSQALDVNNANVVVGSAGIDSGFFEFTHAFVKEPGSAMVDLHPRLPIGPNSSSAATAINDGNVIVGWAEQYHLVPQPPFVIVIDTVYFAYDVDTDTLTELPLRPADLNESGLVVGQAGVRAAAYDMTTGVLTNLGTLGGSQSHANAVNESGVVVGRSDLPNALHAFRYDMAVGVMEDLGTLGGDVSEATGINDLGYIVGESTNSSFQPHPFFYWHANKSMTDLGTIGVYNLLLADDINNNSVVVGWPRTSPEAVGWMTTVRIVPHD
jgi:probable HAF family extracellular repeat protein